MSETNSMPQLSLAPTAPVPEAPAAPTASIQQTPEKPAQAAEPEVAPGLDESQLNDAEKKAINDFIAKVDISNPDHVLLFGLVHLKCDPLAGGRVLAGIGAEFPGLYGLGNIIRDLCHGRQGAIGGGDDTIVGIDKLDLHHILGIKGLGELGAGLIVFVVALAHIGLKEQGAGACLGAETGLHIGIIIGCDRSRQGCDTEQHNGQHNAQGIPKPAPLQALCLFDGTHLHR